MCANKPRSEVFCKGPGCGERNEVEDRVTILGIGAPSQATRARFSRLPSILGECDKELANQEKMSVVLRLRGNKTITLTLI